MRAWLVVGLACLACARQGLRVPTPEEVHVERLVLSPELELAKLRDDVWLHTTWKELPNVGPFPSNGLVVVGDGGVVLIDTPWTPKATRTLLEWVDSRLHLPVTDLIATHSHDDRIGGVSELAPETAVHALQLTIDRAKADGVDLKAAPLAAPYERLVLAGVSVETLYPGPGHAPDNLVVQLRGRQLLFGGCWVRSPASTTLGNLAEADLAGWKKGLEVSSFPDDTPFCAKDPRPLRPMLVVPGHGGLGGDGLFLHTRDLVDAALEAKRP
ncbi:MAG: MBL fold metallo-hydrolase [Myxococcaceae bacterium]|nr:MBL fold metallo-hydrolase [Myxococcaceae bacterium]